MQYQSIRVVRLVSSIPPPLTRNSSSDFPFEWVIVRGTSEPIVFEFAKHVLDEVHLPRGHSR